MTGTARPLLAEVEAFLRASGTSPTRFGRDAVRDPRLVFDLRRGREPSEYLAARVRAFMLSPVRKAA